jgi:hypothetical protein
MFAGDVGWGPSSARGRPPYPTCVAGAPLLVGPAVTGLAVSRPPIMRFISTAAEAGLSAILTLNSLCSMCPVACGSSSSPARADSAAAAAVIWAGGEGVFKACR